MVPKCNIFYRNFNLSLNVHNHFVKYNYCIWSRCSFYVSTSTIYHLQNISFIQIIYWKARTYKYRQNHRSMYMTAYLCSDPSNYLQFICMHFTYIQRVAGSDPFALKSKIIVTKFRSEQICVHFHPNGFQPPCAYQTFLNSKSIYY